MPPIPLLAPEYLESLPAPYTPETPETPKTVPTLPTPLGAPMPTDAPYTLLAPEYLQSLPAPQYTPDTLHPLSAP